MNAVSCDQCVRVPVSVSLLPSNSYQIGLIPLGKRSDRWDLNALQWPCLCGCAPNHRICTAIGTIVWSGLDLALIGLGENMPSLASVFIAKKEFFLLLGQATLSGARSMHKQEQEHMHKVH